MDGQHTSADPSPRPGAADPAEGDLAEAAALSGDTADIHSTVDADDAGDAHSTVDANDAVGSHSTGDASEAAAAVAERPAAESADESPRPPRKPRREKPKRDPHETPFGGLFLDELQRLAGLRGQFAYGVPEKLWRANREQTIRILREEVPMPTFKNQIQCILNADPFALAEDVHYEMLVSATPPEDSFRWLWLYMMLR